MDKVDTSTAAIEAFFTRVPGANAIGYVSDAHGLLRALLAERDAALVDAWSLRERLAAAESGIADPTKIVAWWNGFSVDMTERDLDSLGGWSVSKRENDWHDIPLVAKSNPCNAAIAASQKDKTA